MLSEISAMELRHNLGHILNAVGYQHQPVLIKRAGKPLAVIVDVETYQTKIATDATSKNQKVEMQAFFKKLNLDLSQFQFNRDEANAR